MRIEQLLDRGGVGSSPEEVEEEEEVALKAKRALVGAGARILFYPTLAYNVFRNKIQSEFRWWDRVDEVRIISLLFRANSRVVVHLLVSFFIFSFN